MIAGDKVKVYVTFPESVPVDSLGKVVSLASRCLSWVEPVIIEKFDNIQGLVLVFLESSWHFVTLKTQMFPTFLKSS